MLGYRVDVADVTPPAPGGTPLTPSWESLAKITTTLPASLGTFTGELSVEPAPTRPNTPEGGDSWLPRYFANWRGAPCVSPTRSPGR